MNLATNFILPVLIKVSESVLLVALTWFYKKTIQKTGKFTIDKLLMWMNISVILLIAVVILLSDTFLPDKVKVYVITGLCGVALLLFLIMLRNQKKMYQNQLQTLQNQVSNHPCGVEMLTDKKRFMSKIQSAGIAPIYKIQPGQEDEKVEMTWATFVKGIHILKEDLQKAVEPKVIFGINETGIIMAMYFSALNGHCPVGIVRTGKADPDTGKRWITFEWPQLNEREKQPLSILLVDGEIKSGKSSREIQKEIAEHYKSECLENCITYVALGGVLKNKDTETLTKETLTSNDFGWEIESQYKPAFVAFYSEFPGFFDAPEKLR